jgi:hypothetical protein
VIVRTAARRAAQIALVVIVASGALAGCGDSDDEDQNPDEATFCRLALLNEPVAEADAVVLRRLAELAPDEVDAEVDVLRDAAEELDEHTPNSPEAIALEFEIRFRGDYLAARGVVEDFIADDCREAADLDDDTTDEVDEEKRSEKIDERLS